MKQSIQFWLSCGIALWAQATTSPSVAQIVPDATLPVNSNVTRDGNTNIITGGTQAGANLFHSFEKFSVPTGGAAYFNNALDIQNIISRVTGSSISNIDGLLRANASANLFLLNPNGIIFGPNASLNIGGSILGSTASSINFADGRQFSATNSQAPPLLTVSVPLGLQFGGTAGNILNKSRVTNSNGEVVGLQVQPGKTLALVGGDVSLDSGSLQAPGGRVELGGVSGAGTVGLNVDGSNLRLSFLDGVERAFVSLANRASVNVRASDGGSIAINAQNLNIAQRSTLRVGIDSDLGSIDSVAGDIEINATGTINLTDESSIVNDVVYEESVGNGGNINITTGSLSVTNGAHLVTTTRGQGNAGSVNINARDTVLFNEVSSSGNRSGAFSSVARGAVGNGGNINITTESLSVTNGARLSARTFGRGNAGSVNIHAGSTVSFDGVSRNQPEPSGALSSVGNESVRPEGNGGNINITTGSLDVRNGAQLVASTYGQGNAGSVNINARDIAFDGTTRNGEYSSGAFSSVSPVAVGSSGDITITTGSLDVRNGARLSARTFGRGNAGSVNINARDIVSFDGVESGAFSSVGNRGNTKAVGNGGDINITTGLLSVRNGAVLAASTFAQGNAGNVNINALDAVSFNGSNGQFLSRADSRVEPGAVGNGGNINIRTGSLSFTNGAVVSTSTLGRGNAGNVNINAHDTVSFDGINGQFPSGAFSRMYGGAVGNGGNIRIRTEQLVVRDGAQVSVSSEETGNAGELQIAVRDLLLDNQGSLRASTASGSGGNINLQVRDLIRMRRQGLITAEADDIGNGGNITLNAPFGGVLDLVIAYN